MEATWGFEGVQAGIDEVATVESSREALWSWEVFRWQILFLRDLGAVLLISCLIDKVLLKRLFRVLDVFSISGEVSWDDIFSLDLSVIVLDSSVDLGV